MPFSDHIVAQQADQYIMVFHIAISYDTQRPGYNGRVVGLRAVCMVCVTLTDHCTRWPVYCRLDCSVWNTLNGTRVQAATGAFDVWCTGTLTVRCGDWHSIRRRFHLQHSEMA